MLIEYTFILLCSDFRSNELNQNMNVMLVSEYECNISVDYDDIQFLIL